jgi:hypothetical protein
MPSISIDTFFACTLMVAVVIIATISVTGTMMTRINSWKNLNEETYLRTLYESILSETGTPSNWGSDSNIKPSEFGLANTNSQYPTTLDVDKVTRLNPQNDFALSYTDILSAARLTDVAVKISISQIMNVTISLASNSSQGDSTVYTFRISVNQDSGPVTALLHCYAIAKDFLQDVYNSTSTNGIGYVSFQIPNTSNGTAIVIAFARATQDQMMTACNTQLFAHLSTEPPANQTFLDLTPLNYTLNVSPKSSNTTIESYQAFSYSYQTDLTEISNMSRQIPKMLDASPIVIIVTGMNLSSNFIEWTTYPEIPFETGSNFNNSESHSFSGIATIKDTLYKVTINFGDVNP